MDRRALEPQPDPEEVLARGLRANQLHAAVEAVRVQVGAHALQGREQLVVGDVVDLGDGVVCCEFHAKMNAIGADIILMLHAGVKRLATDFDAMVVANQAANFSVGANLMLLLMYAQEQEWEEIDFAVRQFQNVNLALKYAPRPVVVAPHGLALGGGCEITLHAARAQASAETYIGLVETGVGLIPGGGGTKEMLIRANEHAGILSPLGALMGAPSAESDMDLFHALKPVFENIAMAKVSTSGEEATP